MLDPELVRSALLQYAEDEDGWPSFSYFTAYYDNVNRTFNVPGLGTVKIVAEHGYDSNKSYDGWSENIFVVFEINGVLYKASGSHTSYTGSEWEHELKIVQPVTKSVIEYEEV